ncbi:MAG: hypothetical protein M3Y77_18960 [Actinomycetota bacterium]|nr:hypothetical protein [Actinomycetota bacterium]
MVSKRVTLAAAAAAVLGLAAGSSKSSSNNSAPFTGGPSSSTSAGDTGSVVKSGTRTAQPDPAAGWARETGKPA